MSSITLRLEKLLRALTVPRVRPVAFKRVLIAHQLLLGDTLLLAPLLKQLQILYPDAEHVLLVQPAFLPLFGARPYGVTVMPFQRRDDALQRQVMASGPYDLALVPDDNRYAWLARAAGARWIIGFANDTPSWKNWMLDEHRPYPLEPSSWADLVPRVLLGALPPPFEVGEWPAPASPKVAMPEGRYAVLHVGASTRLKAWPAPYWNQLASALRERGLQVVFSGSEKESVWLEGIEHSAKEIAWFGQLDLAGLWHLLAGASVLVCPDTGIAHLARLVGVPTSAIFGPGSAFLHGAGEFWQTAPFKAHSVVPFPCRDQQRLYRRDVSWVQRCGRGPGVGPGRCPGALCMQAVTPDSVLEALSG